MREVYLDFGATTPVDPRVLEAMRPAWAEVSGNPSSVHLAGRRARRMVEEARAWVAEAVGAAPEEIVFTSGGTEADNLAVLGVVASLGPGRILVSAVEHEAVRAAAGVAARQGCEVREIPVNPEGVVDLQALEDLLLPGTRLVSCMLANNETGAIQPVRQVAALAHARGALVHVDAVAALGRVPIRVDELGADLLSVSAHKVYGPKGVGALYVRRGVPIQPLLVGGPQERSRRAGTENVPGIVGFGAACRLLREEGAVRMEHLRELDREMRRALVERVPGTRLHGPVDDGRVPGCVNVGVSGVDGEALLLRLDLEGIQASSGSACSSGARTPSHVLLAMGIRPEEARASVRFTAGWPTSLEDVRYAGEVFARVVDALRASVETAL